MYSIFEEMIGYSGTSNIQQYILYICACVILLMIGVTIDLLYRLFRHIWRGKS